MEKVELNGYNFELKENYLTAAQVSTLVKEVINIYKDGEYFEDYQFNPIDMEINFYASLFYYLVDGYDTDDNDKFEELFSHGVHRYLLDEIENAQLAYDLMWKTANEISNSLGILIRKVTQLLDNLPNEESLKELTDKLPDEWKTVKSEYDSIVGKKTDENTKEGENAKE